MIPTRSDAENIELIKRVYRVDEIRARFILALQRGRIRGDVLPDEELTTRQRRRLGLGRQIDDKANE